jgi:hypothetical protein
MTNKKSTIAVCGLTALVLAFGLVLTGCPTPTGGGGSPTPDTTPPAKVSGLAAHTGAAATEAWLAWTDPADADFDHVEITGTGITTAAVVAKGVQVLHITGISSGASVTYSVISVDKTGNKSGAATSAALTLAADSTPPGAITGETAAAHASTEGAIAISWTLPAETDIAKVTIGIDDGAAGGSVVDTVDLPRNATSYTWRGLGDTSGGYIFTINTEDFAGNTGTSADTAAAHPRDTTAPAAVTSGAAAAASQALTVTWTDPTDADFKEIKLQAYSNEDCADANKVGNEMTVTATTGTKTVNSSATGGTIAGTTQYWVTITAVDFVGNRSTVVTVTNTTGA